VIIDKPEIGGAQNPDDRGKGNREMPSAPPVALDGVGVADGSFIAHGQLVAAASPAPRQHRPAVLALHSCAKSVAF